MNPPPPDPPARTVVCVRTAVDFWVAVCLAIGPGLALALAIVAWQNGREDEALIVLGVGALSVLVMIPFLVPCRYTLLPDALSIRCGLIHATVPYDQIRDVQLSGSWASGLGLSLRRLAIQTDKRRYLISPIDRESFAKQLRARLR